MQQNPFNYKLSLFGTRKKKKHSSIHDIIPQQGLLSGAQSCTVREKAETAKPVFLQYTPWCENSHVGTPILGCCFGVFEKYPPVSEDV